MADNQNPCDAVLIQDVDYRSSSESSRMAWLKLIDEKTYQQIRLDIAAGVTVPFGDIFVGGDASFASFNERRTAYLQQQAYNESYDGARAEIQRALPEAAIKAWEECMRGPGIRCSSVSADADSVIIEFTWTPPAGVAEGRVTSSEVSGKSTRPWHSVGKGIS